MEDTKHPHIEKKKEGEGGLVWYNNDSLIIQNIGILF